MITVRRGEQREGKQELWRTFQPREEQGAGVGGFGTLELLDEIRLAPGASAPRAAETEIEILSYVREGNLSYHDSFGRSGFGRSGVIQAGEFQLRTVGSGDRRREWNASRTYWVHMFQLTVGPSASALERSTQQKRFSVAERRHGLCVIASPDARKGSLLVRQDAVICSALLYPGQHLVHELSFGRNAWLHLVGGTITLNDLVLTTGDGIGVSEERALSLTAWEASEILVLDLAK